MKIIPKEKERGDTLLVLYWIMKMTNLGALMAGHRAGKARDPNDFNPTIDASVTAAVVSHYETIIPRLVWEPACGTGEMSNALADALPGATIVSTDLIHRGFGLGGIDFLALDSAPFDVPFAIVTNPPFYLAAQFIEHAHRLGAEFIALFLKAQYWNSSTRYALWQKHPPQATHPLTWRVDFTGQGAPTMDCMWNVWGSHVPFSNEPLLRPVKKGGNNGPARRGNARTSRTLQER